MRTLLILVLALSSVSQADGIFFASVDDHAHKTGEVAKCPARSDILFVFDTSGSMSSKQFDLSKKFATRLTEHFRIGDKDVRFAAITFSDRVQEVFDFNTYDNHSGISLGLALTPALGGSRETYLALDYVHTHGLFSTSRGARDVSSKILVLITHGSSDNDFRTEAAGDVLKRLYHVIAVGIASGLGGEFDGWEYEDIASNYKNVFTADNFDNLVLIAPRVARRLCEIPEADGNSPTTGSAGNDTCLQGFEKSSINPTACLDINECETGHSCQQTCVNMIGGYRCTCQAGSVIDPKDTSRCLKITQCPAPVDIVFVLDASGSIGPENFKTQQTFVAKLTHHFNVGPRGALFGGLLFATNIVKLFDLKTYTSGTDVSTSILGAPRYIRGGTNTHRALRYIQDQGMFSPASGGRSSAPDVVVIVTDGTDSNRSSTKAAADALKSQGVQVFAVGIGEQADLVMLADLASKSTNVFGAIDFDLLDYIQQSLADSICSSVSG